ncbi:MAG: hypothetical protein NT075_09950 [Chloroflexi bacterium]|nr:hypothetical protein [Chloroflexota bacterium]
MKYWMQHRWAAFELSLPWLVLVVLALYTYVELSYAPYVGFRFASNSEINGVFVTNPGGMNLQEGDRLIQVGSVTWHEYSTNLRQPLFEGIETDQILPIIVERNHQLLTIPWLIQGPSPSEIIDRVINTWWLAYVFWLAGAATLLFLRPKDTRWRLLSAFYFLTAIWLVAGNVSHWAMWDSAIVLRMAIWLSVPVCLHLHLLFPHPLLKPKRALVWMSYGLSVVLATLQWFQLLPARAYLFGFLLAMIGSLLLLIVQFIQQSNERRQVRFLLAIIALVFVSIAAVSILQVFRINTWLGRVGLFVFPLMPAAYFYAAFRRQLGRQELRANKLLTLYVFIVAVGTMMTLLITIIVLQPAFSEQTTLIGVTASLVTAILTALGFQSFQRWIETRLLSMPLAPIELVETYMARITTSLSYDSLSQLLCDEVLPSLLIRQSALVQLDGANIARTIYLQGVDEALLPGPADVQTWLTRTQTYRLSPAEIHAQPYGWAHLVIPLWINNQCIGLWLFGKRDPDDFYAQSEMATFLVLANQTAVALTNINQAEQLRVVYQANIDRHEVERTSLAHVLHDEILHQLALLSMYIEEIKASPQFDGAYQALTMQIRQIITGLRPAMMNYGLGAALEELTEALEERGGDANEFQINLTETQARYPVRVEQYLFRIVQQACENALRHAHATNIRIDGQLAPGSIRLVVTDNGQGFPAGQSLDLTKLLANKHFGLVGMYERSAIIQADLQIESTLGQGTQVTVAWQADEAASADL